MGIGMYLHHSANPVSPNANKIVKAPVTVSPIEGEIDLHIYFPPDYDTADPPRTYPVVVNFHGGGFTIGSATDDARWARAVNEYADAICVCVAYRLAPEHPFPTPVEDGVDAALYLVHHADELRVDPHRMAFSGFSAGGNMAFSVPIRFAEEYSLRRVKGNPEPVQVAPVAIAAWYPSLDFTVPRAERRGTNVRHDKEMAKFFHDLFDASYLHPPKEVDLHSPWLSPARAPDVMVKDLPKNIILYACEWDGLLLEAEKFRDRLRADFPEKSVVFKKILGVSHGFDRSPNPLTWDPKTEAMYKDVCDELRMVFYGPKIDGKIEDKDHEISLPTALEAQQILSH